MTPEQVASLSPADRRALLEALRLHGAAAPEDPNLDAAATPLTPDPELTPRPRRLTQYEEELRLRRLARRAGVSADAAEAMLVADAAGDFDRLKHLRRAGDDKSDEDRASRQAEVVKRAQLRQNPMGYIGRDDLTADQRRIATESLPINPYQAQLRLGAGESDARVRVAQIEAEGRRAAADAEAANRDATQKWMMEFKARADREAEAMRIAAEERARAAGVADKHEEREFNREQNDLNRQAAAAQGNERTLSELRKLQAELDARRLEADERRAQLQAQQTDAERRHEQVMLQMQADRESNNARWSAQSADAAAARAQEQQKIDAALAAKQAQEAEAARALIIDPMRTQYGPGVDELVGGVYDTPGAESSLRRIAADADNSLTGFYHSDAIRMDAILFRLGVTDPAIRHRLVEKYGMAGMGASSGGRSGPVSGFVNWMRGGPQYPERKPAADGAVPAL